MTPELDSVTYKLRCSYCSIRTELEVNSKPTTQNQILGLARSIDWAATMDPVNKRALVFCSECCETRQKFKRLRSLSKLLLLTKRNT